MANGLLGKANIPANIDYLLYDFNTAGTNTATVNLNVVNIGTTTALIDIKISAGDNTFDDYIVYQEELKPNEELERVGLVLSLSERIIVNSSTDKTVWRVHGFEENLTGFNGKLASAKPTKNTPTVLYWFNTQDLEISTNSLYVVNVSDQPSTISIFIAGDISTNRGDAIVYEYILDPKENLEIAGIVMGIGEKMTILTDSNDTVWRIHGFEENLTKLKGNTSGNVNNAPSLVGLVVNMPTSIKTNSTLNISFGGATDIDGDILTYHISDYGNLQFSKVDNIIAGEQIALTTPNVLTFTMASYILTVKDSKGGQSSRKISFIIEP